MTWNHARGIEPLLAATSAWKRQGGEHIEWDGRSLQDFESFPLDVLACEYDLLVIDHPHVGAAAEAQCLVPFRDDLGSFDDGSIGGSCASYRWHDRQWALPIDAAAQVQAWVPHRSAGPVACWSQLAELAAAQVLALPLRSPHALMSLFTLCGLLGIELDGGGHALFPAAARRAYALLSALANAVDPVMYDLDPIGVLEEMAREGSRISVAPLIYGYVSYARDGFRQREIHFADIPVMANGRPQGSTLGGTGIAVSALGSNVREAIRFARWVASGTVQAGLFAQNGGQPAHRAAWEAESNNAVTGNFYRATQQTLDLAWTRPRHPGYMTFQQAASSRLERALRQNEDGEALFRDLNGLFADSRSLAR